MNDKNDNTQLIAILYLACCIICVVRTFLSLYAGNTGAAVLRAILAVIFLIIFFLYKRKNGGTNQ